MDPIALLLGLGVLGMVAMAALLLAAYVQHRDELAEMFCWIPEPHPWHEGCWQTRPTEETE